MTTFAKHRGFSLMELMIAIVISGVIAAVAWPSYKSHIEKSKNAEVQNTLLNIVALQTQFFTENRSYADKLTGTTDSLNIPLVEDPAGNSPGARKLVTPTKHHLIHLTTVSADPSTTPPTPASYQLVSKPYYDSSSTAENKSGIQYYVDQTGLKKSHQGDGGALLDFSAGASDFEISGWD